MTKLKRTGNNTGFAGPERPTMKPVVQHPANLTMAPTVKR